MMNQVNPYGSIQKRTFAAALLHRLETEWGLLGGRRILQMLVDDVEELREEFFPPLDNVGSGTLIWTCTKDVGRKAKPGKRTEEYETVTVKLPLITAEDVADRIEGRTPPGKAAEKVKERDKKRVARIVKAAAEQGGLLTVAELVSSQ